MRATHSTSVDGRRLLHVTFERESPDADAPTIEAVFEVHYPEDFRLDNEHAKVLIPLSVTRVDTREQEPLSSDESHRVYEEASSYSAELTQDDFDV